MFYLVQVGTTIYVVTESGSVYQALTMPAGVTIDATKRARFAVLNQKIIIAHAPSVTVWVDPATFTVYKLAIVAPTTNLAAADGGAGALLGAYQWWYSFVHKISGTLMNESPLSPVSATVTLAGRQAALTSIDVDAVVGSPTTGRRIYRTAAGQAVPLFAFDIDDNVATTATDTVADASLGDAFDTDVQNAQAGSDGSSRFKLLVVHKDRLFGVPDTLTATTSLVDHLLYTNPRQMYAWSALNDVPVSPTGDDRYGIVGLASRRDGLCVLKRANCQKLIGSSNDDFELISIKERVGCLAADSVVTINDTIYWLGADGVYRWDDNDGVTCVTRDQVDAWFTTDTTFNRAAFPNASASWNPLTNCYVLLLTSAGGSGLDRWVAMTLDDPSHPRWFGPHRTSAFTPASRLLLRTSAGLWRSFMGGTDGYLYVENGDGENDVSGAGVSYAVASSWTITPMTEGDPAMTHFFGQVHVVFRKEAAGLTLTLTPTVGNLDDVSTFSVTVALDARSTFRTRTLGVGQVCFLQFTQNTLGARFLLYGLDITPIGIVGRRL